MADISPQQNGKEGNNMTKFPIACADFTFPLLEHDKVLDLIALLDCDGVDIGLFNGRSHLQPVTEFTNIQANAKKLKTKLAERYLAASDVYLQLDTDLAAKAINHPSRATRIMAREEFLKLIEYASALGADHITTVPGMYFDEHPEKQSLELIHEELAWRVERVKNSSLAFAVEAHVGSPFIDPTAAAALVDAVPGLTLTLDYTHFVKQGYEQKEADILLPYASHFHARGARPGRLQTSMKNNVIDYTGIIHKLMAQGYSGWIGLEYIWIEWEQCNDVDNISESIRLREVIKNAFQ